MGQELIGQGELGDFADVGAGEARRRHADNGYRKAFDEQGCADGGAAALKAAVPIGVGNYGDEASAGTVVFGYEEATGGGGQLERLEESAADPGAGGAHGSGGRSDREGVAGEAAQGCEDVLAL